MSPPPHRPNWKRWDVVLVVLGCWCSFVASMIFFLVQEGGGGGELPTTTAHHQTTRSTTARAYSFPSWPHPPGLPLLRRRRRRCGRTTITRQLQEEDEDNEPQPPWRTNDTTKSTITLEEDVLLLRLEEDVDEQNTTRIDDDDEEVSQEQQEHYWYYNLQEPMEYTVAIRRREGENDETAAAAAVEEEPQEWFHQAMTQVALDLLLFDEWNATTPTELFPVQLVDWQAYYYTTTTTSGDVVDDSTPNSRCTATSSTNWKCWTITQTLWIRQQAATTTTTKNNNEDMNHTVLEEEREWLDQAQEWEASLRTSILLDVLVLENGGNNNNNNNSMMSTLTTEFQQVVQSIVPPGIEIASILLDDSEDENDQEETETDSTPTDTTTTPVSSSPTIINGTTQDTLQDDDTTITTTTTTDTKMIPPDNDGLQGWAIFLIGLLGAVSSCFLYGICFYKDHNYYHSKPKPAEIAIQVEDNPSSGPIVVRDVPSSPPLSPEKKRRRLSLSSRQSQHSARSHGGAATTAISSPSRPKPKSILKKEELEVGMYEDALAGRSPTRSLNSASVESRHSQHHVLVAAQSIRKLSVEGDDPTTNKVVLTPRTKHKHSLAVDATGQVVSRQGISMVQASDRGLYVFEDTESTSSRGLARAVGVTTNSSSRRDVYSPTSPPTANMDDIIVDPDDTSDDDSSYARQFKAPKTKVVTKATPPSLSPEDDPYFSEGEYQTQPLATGANVVSPYASSQNDASVGEDDPELVYGGVYYGSDADDDDDDYESDGDIERMYSLNTGGGLMGHTTIPPVYGGVYYGSDGEADEDQVETPALVTPTKSSSSSNVVVNPPTMDYFTGIQPSRRTSNKKKRSSSSSRPQKYYNLTDPSVTSSLTNDSAEFHSVSSMLSVDEREWQRRNRQDWLHPVNEDEHDYHHSHSHGQS